MAPTAGLFEEAKDNSTDIEAEEQLDILEKGSAHVYSYNKQVFCYWVGSRTWNKYYQGKNKNLVLVTMDYAIKWLQKVPRETQPEWLQKWYQLAYYSI